MVEYQKVVTSFFLVDYLLNPNKKTSKPSERKKNMGLILIIQMLRRKSSYEYSSGVMASRRRKLQNVRKNTGIS